MRQQTLAGPERVPVTEFRANLPRFLREAKAGKSFLLTSHDEVVAEIHPPPRAALLPREPGAMRGQFTVPDDFDETSDDILDAMGA